MSSYSKIVISHMSLRDMIEPLKRHVDFDKILFYESLPFPPSSFPFSSFIPLPSRSYSLFLKHQSFLRSVGLGSRFYSLTGSFVISEVVTVSLRPTSRRVLLRSSWDTVKPNLPFDLIWEDHDRYFRTKV